jgi:hypothetical protein
MIKLFAHRGFVIKNIQQNSIASLQEAVKQNFEAIEFDIWFLNGKLLLKHDRPEEGDLENLPVLSDYLVFKNSLEYWMDFKNLHEVDAREALMLVKKDIDDSGISLKQIYFAPFITDHKKATKVFKVVRKIFGEGVNLVGVCEKIENEQELEDLKIFLADNKVKFLSIFHGLLTEEFVKKFKDVEFLAWTVNDLAAVPELVKLGIKNFATDHITPQHFLMDKLKGVLDSVIHK